MAPLVGRGRCLGGPVERARHVEHQLFAPQVKKLARNLFANGCQMPLELGIGRTVLKYRGSGRGPRPRRDENNEGCPGLS